MGCDITIDGIEEQQGRFEEIQESAEQLDGRNEVTFGELYSDHFLKRNSEFESISEFFEASRWEVETPEDLEAISDAKMDRYVREHTTFDSSEEMLQAAAEEWTADQLEI